ncbi:HAD family hydrolase [Urechidicola croceus]|uniref:HAD family hydrolase n=1 Tax=Urechidicola croceus TaxID=1850246 RepID=A0A1D8P4F1_9FLAO|nr:HAD family phosphatase [Urechidicola croceus]AOW19452.1 HAD family hydrolase [Urechidicola croceus]
MNSKIDTIIFDLGGVLVDWNPQYLYEKIFSTQEEIDWFLNNVCTPDWNIEQDAGRTIAEANTIKIKEFPKYSNEIKLFYDRWEEMFSGPIHKSVEIQQKLLKSPNYRVYALTNWSAETWDRGRNLFPFLNDFEGVIVSGQEKMRKPYDEIYQLIINRFNITPENSVFIDDNYENTVAATKNGINSIHFKTSEKLLIDLQKLNVII